MLYSLDEICLIPGTYSKIEHRGDVNVLTNKNNYPIFTAPMASVVDNSNIEVLKKHKLNVIVPRTVKWEDRLKHITAGNWVAVGFKEAQIILENLKIESGFVRLCIDQANGHMDALLRLCKQLKNKFGERVIIMTGNVANPYTYKKYAEFGIDYIRVGIGSGNVCTTSVQCGMHYPIGSLIINMIKEREMVQKAMKVSNNAYLSVPKIIADGGFKRVDQCIKALALGADYVMLGEIIAKSEEACGKIVTKKNKNGHKEREYFGMSTEKAQLLINETSFFKDPKFKPKHSEGLVKTVEVIYKLADWTADFEHALRTSMSYHGAHRLDQFIGKVAWDTMTPVTYNAYMK